MTRIVANPGILGGKPIVEGTRLSVEHILGLLASGMSHAGDHCRLSAFNGRKHSSGARLCSTRIAKRHLHRYAFSARWGILTMLPTLVADANIAFSVVRFLRSQGIDVRYARGRGLAAL